MPVRPDASRPLGGVYGMCRAAELRDRLLTADIRDLLAHDRRVQGIELAVTVRGGVAHVAGEVPSEDMRRLLRRLIGRVRGIHAVWDVLRLSGEGPPCILDLGCGAQKQHAGAIGLDCYRLPGVDLLAHLERGLPIASDRVDQVYAVHVLEHVHALVPLMNEIHRVLKPDGVLHVMVPHWQFINAVADPTHVRLFCAQTFKYFCRPGPGIRVFRPLAVSTTADSVLADLQPVKNGESPPSEEDLARFFD